MILRRIGRYAAPLLLAVTAGCGGGGGDDGGGGAGVGGGGGGGPSGSGWVAGSFLPASSFAGKCVAPRSGTDPETGLPYNETRGTATDENNFLRSWSNDLYLWYNEIVDRDPGLHTTAQYFDLLKTPAVTTSGRPKDRFHFTYPTSEWLSLSQSGVEASYGAEWAIVASQPPRRIVVAYTEPGSPARTAGSAFNRGSIVVRIDDVDVVNSNVQADINRFIAGLYPDAVGEAHTFVMRELSGVERTVTLTSAAVTKTPVVSSVVDSNGGRVGYLLFTDHIRTAEQPLVAAIEQMRAANVSDLVLDLRYNGGGYLFLASQLAYMIAGPARTSGQTFERLQFNDKHTSIDPVTRQALTPLPFLSTTSTNPPQQLPALNLSRVYVLTGGTTCSASESIINSLRGVGVEVVQIGSTTCGKPYGFYPEDNCGTTYFSIQFKGVNAAGFGDYADGFSPNNTVGVGGERLPGCSVADDFAAALGDTNEDLLQSALSRRIGQACPVPSGSKPSFSKPFNGAAGEEAGVVVVKSPWLMNRWFDE